MNDVVNNYLEQLLEEREKILFASKTRLEEQITQATAKEKELPEEFEDQRREKLADTIKELKRIEFIKEHYIILRKKEDSL